MSTTGAGATRRPCSATSSAWRICRPTGPAQIIVRGVERGNERIRVGLDAVATDLLQRIAPRRYYDVIKRLEPFMRQAEGAEAEAAPARLATPAPATADRARERSGAA